MPSIKGLNHITLAVSSLDHSFDFYTQFLGMKPEAKWQTGAYLSASALWLCLTADDVKPSRDYTHIAFTIQSADYKYWEQKLRADNFKFWKQNTSEGNSIYFLDPDGHKLELHVGDLASRLQSLKANPYRDQQLY